MQTLLIIILIIIAVVVLWVIIKPYTIKYDTTLFITGGLGSGKTLTQVKIAVNLLRRMRIKWGFQTYIVRPIKNAFIRSYNKKQIKSKKPLKLKNPIQKTIKPQIYSNIPIHYKPSMWSNKREWAKVLRKEHLLLTREMAQYSIVLIDELPQLVNQFNWNVDEVQHNINEFITYFRHYYGGYFLANAQSMDDVVCQIRRKGNIAIWCYDFKKWLFGLFYTIRMCDIMLSEEVSTTTTSQVEENTKLHFGLFPPKGTYDTRCYSERINNILTPLEDKERQFERLKTNKILRIENYISPLDDSTTNAQKIEMENKILTNDEKEQRKHESK